MAIGPVQYRKRPKEKKAGPPYTPLLWLWEAIPVQVVIVQTGTGTTGGTGKARKQ